MQNVTQSPERSLALHIFVKGGCAGFRLPACVEESGGTIDRSSTRSLDDFGAAGCFTVAMFSCERKHHKSSYWRDTAAAPALSYYVPRLHGQIVDCSVIGACTALLQNCRATTEDPAEVPCKHQSLSAVQRTLHNCRAGSIKWCSVIGACTALLHGSYAGSSLLHGTSAGLLLL